MLTEFQYTFLFLFFLSIFVDGCNSFIELKGETEENEKKKMR
jgi:hypothetical protein